MATSLTSDVFLTCTAASAAAATTVTQVTTAVFTVTYSRILLAACPTSEWLATYYVTEVCTGDQATWTTPAIPPNFAVTTVGCNVCAKPQVTITCPVELASQTGQMTINGNGVTATGMTPMGAAAAAPTHAPGHVAGAADAAPAGTAPYVTAGASRGITLKETMLLLLPGAMALLPAVLL